MRRDEVLSAFGRQLSGIRMLETASEIARHHRVPGSPGYAAAADVILGRLADAGVPAVVHEYPADGEAKTYDWTAPLAWSVRSGTLAEASASARLIVDFDEIAQGVVVHSPGGTFEGELVHVGAPARDAAYDAFDLAGKVALVCASASDVVLRAARRGAVGVVVYPNDERSAASHDLVQYHSLFPHAADVPHLVPAFSVSRRTADRWVRQLASGAVILRGSVDAEFHPGTLKVVEATVPGTASGAASVLFSAHLCHPRGSANDNASGAAVVAELARVVALSPLRAGTRFLWMAEFYGSLPWAAAHAPELAATEFALNLDMVGSSPEKVGEPLRIFRAANHTPHYVNALVEPLAALVAVDRGSVSAHGSVRPLHWSFDLPSGGSDHLTFGAAPHRRAALMFGHDDPYWHTDLDTVDRIDPTRMKHVAMLAAGLAQAGAPDASEVERIWGDLLVHAAGELARAADIGRTLESGLAGRLLDLSLGVEIERARTLRSVGSRKQTKRVALLRAIRGELSTSRDGAASGPQPDEPRPTRQVDGPLAHAVTERFTDEEREFFKDRFGVNHRALAAGLLNHCDGTKTPSDIALLLSLDAGRAVDIDDVRRGIELLRKTSYVA